ncbi:hypothetical protein D9611_007147 [Ephemerocybe angulata]|uniref:Zn(2)-C6 fungal-type domain-containing protein n=1 Tax=Ephemerocybe angulata TaxID=980116 RepID=A0A8H5B2Q3_9AGAR|nr:hypothetical protein D9611_007147 [Tulosesus angulatus]
MPETTQSGGTLSTKLKQSRLRGACDQCRQKKLKCDSAKMPGKRCSRCTTSGLDCTRLLVVKQTLYNFGSMGNTVPAPSIKNASLGEAQALMSPLIDAILGPHYHPPTNPILLLETFSSLAQYARLLEKSLCKGHPSEFTGATSTGSELQPEGDAQEDDTPIKKEPQSPLLDDICSLSDNLRKNLLLESFAPQRFYGASSTVMLVKAAIDLSVAGTEQTIAWLSKNKRPQYWTIRPWEIVPDQEYPPYIFPDNDLLLHLVDEYFTKSNTLLPLLHRPIFEAGLKAGLHLVDDDFGGTVLAVCANGALSTSDPRVLLNVPHSEQSAGFKYYRQLRLTRESFLRTPSLLDLQTHTLAALYLRSSSRLDKCWHLIGVTLRAAHELGLHRKQSRTGRTTVHNELCKRIFFSSVVCEKFISAALGRPTCIRRWDYDLDRPIECDDEFWENEDPELAFVQPAGRHSEITHFNKLLDLLEVFDDVQAAIYSVRKPPPSKGLSVEEWNEQQLAGFDSALNSWYENIPEFLRWHPDAPNIVFFNQSAQLFVGFNWVKIMMHRPFITLKSRVTRTFSSMNICTNAARAVIRIMSAQSRRSFPLPLVGISVGVSATVLLVNMWKERKAGNPINDKREVDTIVKAIEILRAYERCWQYAGRCCDLLYSLLTMNRATSASTDRTNHSEGGPNNSTPYLQGPVYSADMSNPSMHGQTSAATLFGDQENAVWGQPLPPANAQMPYGPAQRVVSNVFNLLPPQGDANRSAQDFNTVPFDPIIDFSEDIAVDFNTPEWSDYLDNLGALVLETGDYQSAYGVKSNVFY